VKEQETKGAAQEAAQPAVTPAVPPEGDPLSQPEGDQITMTQDAYDKAINAVKAERGREIKEAKDEAVAARAEVDSLRTAQDGIITSQRQARLDAVKDTPEEQAKLRDTFAAEDKDTALTRRSTELDVRERQIAANATADNSTLAAGKARELEASTGIDASVLLTHALVLDKAEDGTVTVNIERMEALAGTLKGAETEKGIEAVGANTPAALAAAASDKDFMRDWGKGLVPSTADNQKRADRINQALPTTV